MSLKYCPNCGEIIYDEYKYCPYCNEDLAVYTQNFNANNASKLLSGLLNLLGEPTVKEIYTTRAEPLSYEDRKKRAKYSVLQEKFESAKADYEYLLTKTPDDLDCYIGIVRALSENYTKLEGEDIEKAVRIVNNVVGERAACEYDAEYDGFIYRKTQHDLRADCEINDNELVKYIGNKSKVIIPDGIVTIAVDAFRENKIITEVVIPKGVTSIGNQAFYNCNNLVKVTLNEGLNEIGAYAFMCCSNLAEINLPEGLKIIRNHAFESCYTLKSLNLPNGLEEIGERAFYRCTNLDVKIPNSVNFLLKEALSYTKISELTIPENIKRIEPYLCYGCRSLTKVLFHKNVTEISAYSFISCDNLKEVTVLENCAIASTAFLSTIVINKTL
ncbi:MAG: leucine-rich repeat protein [Clostridia bacterium]|nr:leucine-rich repeat protein [Clostridia bacterium]